MKQSTYTLLTSFVWFMTAVCYVTSADDVLAYFLMEDTKFTVLLSGLVAGYCIYEMNVMSLNFLRKKYYGEENDDV